MNGKVRAGILSLKGIMCVLACVQTAVAADPQTIYQESATALYNLDFSTAQHGYETLTQDYPENPDYWNALASSVWLKIIYDQQKLNIESFSGRATFGTRESKDAVNAGSPAVGASAVRAEMSCLRRTVMTMDADVVVPSSASATRDTVVRPNGSEPDATTVTEVPSGVIASGAAGLTA